MPAPRAVLSDLAEHGLNPTKIHSTVGASGRLKAPAVNGGVQRPVKKKAPKVSLKAPEKVSIEKKVESVVELNVNVDPEKIVEPVTLEQKEEPKVEVSASKPVRGPKAKKVEPEVS